MGLTKPSGFRVSTEHLTWLRMFTDVLPMKWPGMPVRDKVPRIIRSAFNYRAFIGTISLA
jgi:hypothetical protein